MKFNFDKLRSKAKTTPGLKTLFSYIEDYRKKYDHKVSVFLFFLFLSTIFWLLSSFNQTYIAELQTKVRFENFPRTKILVNDLPEELLLRVEAKGSAILKKKLNLGVQTVIFDVNSYLLKQVKEGNSNNLYILTDNAKQRLQEQFEKIEILNIYPDTIFFVFDDKITKSVPIFPDIQVIFEKQFIQKGELNLDPNEIKISGPSFIVDTLKSISTENYRFIGLNDSINKQINLQIPDKIEAPFNQSTLKIYVEKFTESEIVIPITIENLPDSVSIKLFPPNITVRYHVGMSNFERVNSSQFECTVNYDDLKTENSATRCSLIKSPDFINVLGYYPKKVEFIIEHK